MVNDLNSLKRYIEKDLDRKNVDFFSNTEIEKSFIYSEFESLEENEEYEKIFNSLLDANSNQSIAILGEGGQGKSQFLKMIYKDLYNKGKFPIFISLQNFGLWQLANNASLIDYIKHLTNFDIGNIENKIVSNISVDDIYKNYFLLLDGLDEYDKDVVNLLNNEILPIQNNFKTIITSRYTHSIYLNSFKKVKIKKFNDKQIVEYLKLVLDNEKANAIGSLLRQKQDLKTLAQTPLFLAFLVRLYKNNPFLFDKINSKSDFLSSIFDVLCDEKNLDISIWENYYKSCLNALLI